jgi:hypothetical protein
MPLFSVAEARAFTYGALGAPLASEASYSDEELEACQAAIKEAFERECGVAFEPTERTVELDGTGTRSVLLPDLRVTLVSAASIDGTPLTEAELADLAVYSHGKVVRRTLGSWPRGNLNISLTYQHGHPAVPGDIRRAALLEAVRRLVPSGLPQETQLQYLADGSRYTLSEEGREVWRILQRFNERAPRVG